MLEPIRYGNSDCNRALNGRLRFLHEIRIESIAQREIESGSRKHLGQTLLPLHFNFCRTTLKNDTSGITASGNVLSAFRIVTTAPTSSGNGSRPSTLR